MANKLESKLSDKELLEEIRSGFLNSVMEILGLSKISPSRIVDALNDYRNSH